MYVVQSHPFHLVSPSPWPLLSSISLLALTSAGVLAMQGFSNSLPLCISALLSVVGSMALWFKDVASEGSLLGDHTRKVQSGLRSGVILFIVSEALFFFAVFWAFFHSALSPSVELGCQWPPAGIAAIDPMELPLLNTVLLLSSGVTVTYAHHALIARDRKGAIIGFLATLAVATAFTFLQWVEYRTSSFTLSDGVFGSCFYFGTGFHGIHVIVGTLFIGVALVRTLNYQLTGEHHLGAEASILYWHFVDVVWLLLYVSIYYWGS